LQAEAAGQPESPAFTLELARGTTVLPRRRIDRALTLVGRSPACALRLSDRSVSPFHCSLLRTADGLWVVDLLGKGGVWVNGRPMRWARLEDEARVHLGSYAFRVHSPRPAFTAPSDQFLEAQSIGESRSPEGQHRYEAPAAADETAALRGASQLIPAPPELNLAYPLSGGLMPPSLLPFASACSPLDTASLPVLMLQQFTMLQQQMLAQFQQSMLVMAQVITALRHEEMDLLREVLERLGRLKQRVSNLSAGQRKQASRRKRRADEDRAVASPAGTPNEPLTDTHGLLGPSPVNGEAAGTTAFPGESLDPNFHAWLSGRIATLDKDRQGLWRKFVAMLLGK
jgi:predicted component of type VI protein secretion system